MKNIGLYDKDLSVPRKKDVDAKQDKITASGILKGDGTGGITAAVANTDYATCTNLRNGSAEGSLRTVNSWDENADIYVMGEKAFAEGNLTRASGSYSHAEGDYTLAFGFTSHAEGFATEARGAWSHAEGSDTVANPAYQHVQGKFNIAEDSPVDPSDAGNYAHIVGNGISTTKRSNAHTLDWSGNAWFAGNVYVGSTSGKNKDDGSKKLATIDDVASSAEGFAQNYSIYYTYSSGTIKDGDIVLESPEILTELINQSTSAWVAQNNYVGISRPVIIATFESEPSGEFNNKVLLSLNTVDTVTTTATFSGIYRNSANKMFLCEISFNFTNHNIGVGYTETSKSDTFIATIGTTTYNDVLAAYNAGKIIYAKDTDGNMYQLSIEMDVPTIFSFINFYLAINHSASYEVRGYTLSSDSGWSNEIITYGDSLIPQPSSTLPLAPGTAATGTSTDYSRGDHVHPSEVFIATYDTTTYAEIKAAYDAGKAVFCDYYKSLVPLAQFNSVGGANFYSIRENNNIVHIYCQENSNWHSLDSYYVPTTRKINNKSLFSNITLGNTYNATLTSSGWTSSSGTLTQNLTVSGIVATYNAAPSIDLALDQATTANKKSVADAWGKISGYMEANTAANSITFTVYADTAPTVDIPIRITTYD